MAKRQSSSPAWKKLVVSSPGSHTKAQRPAGEVVIERNLRIPMRDGTELGATLWRPGRKSSYPALVERGPHRLEERTGAAGQYYAARGYCVLSVGLRGCSGSGGEFRGPIPGSPRGDGYDTIEWTAVQDWCNGHVGMLCGSISGLTQYQTVVEAPPHLDALLVREGLFGLGDASIFSPLVLHFVAASWTENQLEHYPPEKLAKAKRLVRSWQESVREAQQAADPDSPFAPVPRIIERLPVCPNPLFAGVADYYNDILLPAKKRGWIAEARLSDSADQTRAPVCHLGGWFDSSVTDTLAAFTAMQSSAATEQARKAQRLIIGPWVHGPGNTGSKPVGLLEFGPNAALDFMAFRQRWYDAQLRRKGSLKQDPAAWLYLIGPDRWLGCDTWPPQQTQPTPWYLHTDSLKTTAPESAQNPDAFEYDPNDPVRTLKDGGAMNIGADQRPNEHRLLCYTSKPLREDLTLVGPLTTILHAASSALDTDWVVRLTWVRSGGASVIISGGALRARYRHGRQSQALLTPDKPERFSVDMMPVSIVIPKGARLRLTITSSDHPAIDRNLNTGQPLDKAKKSQAAINMIYHDRLRPSHVVLPILGSPC